MGLDGNDVVVMVVCSGMPGMLGCCAAGYRIGIGIGSGIGIAMGGKSVLIFVVWGYNSIRISVLAYGAPPVVDCKFRFPGVGYSCSW